MLDFRPALHGGLAAALLAVPAREAAGQNQPSDPASLAVQERAAAEASGRDGFAPALLAVLARDGAVLWPGAPVVVGTDQARRLLEAQRALDSLRITWQPLGLEVASDGSLGVTWGVAAAAREGGTLRIGRYIATWRPDGESWKLAAIVVVGLSAAGSTALPADLGALRRAPLAPAGNAAHFVAADLAFARLAADSGAARAFTRFAAPDAVTFGGVGLLNRGPAAIGAALEAGAASRWSWHPVLAGASASGDLGFTVGEAEIRPGSGPVSYSKYLTVWRRLPGGEVRFLTDGGNARPATPTP
jgi:ketosteroid isomerase-like protein